MEVFERATVLNNTSTNHIGIYNIQYKLKYYIHTIICGFGYF